MKRFITIVVILCIGIIVSLTVNAQIDRGLNKNLFENPHFAKVLKHLNPEDIRDAGLPQKTYGYAWDADWVLEFYYETLYYPNGYPHVDTDYDIGTNLPNYRSTYYWDGEGRITEMLEETNESGSWENAYKYTLTYDTHGNLDTVSEYVWWGEPDPSWWMMNGYQYSYEYTPEDWVSSISTQNYSYTSGWYWMVKETYTLDANGYPTQILFQEWDLYELDWKDFYHYIDIDWHEYDPGAGYSSLLGTAVASFVYFVEELWEYDFWDPNIRESTVYDANGGWEMTREMYWGGGYWGNYIRETLTVLNNYPQLFKHEEWFADSWYHSSGEQYFYTFDGENLTEEIIQAYDPSLEEPYVNDEKYVYGDFFYATGQDEVRSEFELFVYPDPVSTAITIEIPALILQNTYLTILNLDGKQLITRRITEPKTDIDVDALQSGVYFVRVQNDRTVMVEKIIKQ
ncbi:MAG TPA: T9SS type A sorting domain-containing protein [Bacteroidales bacterium]|nr:T9SS type A sorting domain-containing protein [Bacteroidales bacterium]